MISESKRFVFVHIPRTAGTSVETALAAYAREPVGFTVEANTVLSHKHSPAFELRAHVGPAFWDAAFVFSVVRDPWARMHSDYHFFREVGPRLLPEFSPRERWLTEQAGLLGFESWLRLGADVLGISQSSYLTDAAGDLLVDYVARFEHIEADFAAVCRALGVEHRLPRVNGTRRGDHRAAYSADAVELVARYAADDLRRFGYRFAR